MILSDSKILEEIAKGTIVITPYDRQRLGSNSYDVGLGKYLATYVDERLDARKHNKIKIFEIPKEGYLLTPEQFILGTTEEYTETHAHVPFLEGKSSTGRLGIDIHATAGKGDVGFKGNWTLEISCKKPVTIYAGMPIGQLIYIAADGEILNAYDKKKDAKYSGQPGEPVESMMWKNFYNFEPIQAPETLNRGDLVFVHKTMATIAYIIDGKLVFEESDIESTGYENAKLMIPKF